VIPVVVNTLYRAEMVGAPRFELGTPSPPDWCANRAALRSETIESLDISSSYPRSSIDANQRAHEPVRLTRGNGDVA
jgi:hypothetical protein